MITILKIVITRKEWSSLIFYFVYAVIMLLSTVILHLHGSLLDNSWSKSLVLQAKRLLDELCHIIRLVLDLPVTVTSIVSMVGASVFKI